MTKILLATIISGFLFVSTSAVAQSAHATQQIAQNSQPSLPLNNPAIPNTNTPAMINPSSSIGGNSNLPSSAGTYSSGSNDNPSGMNSDLHINSIGITTPSSTSTTNSDTSSTAVPSGSH